MQPAMWREGAGLSTPPRALQGAFGQSLSSSAGAALCAGCMQFAHPTRTLLRLKGFTRRPCKNATRPMKTGQIERWRLVRTS